MALITLMMIVVNGLRLGKMDYIKHFCPGPWWMAPILVPVEIVGLLAKIFALTVRLFANMVAGHLVLAVLLSFILSAGATSAALGLGIAVPVVFGSVALSMLESLRGLSAGVHLHVLDHAVHRHVGDLPPRRPRRGDGALSDDGVKFAMPRTAGRRGRKA